jgi:hypothetical protein
LDTNRDVPATGRAAYVGYAICPRWAEQLIGSILESPATSGGCFEGYAEP